MGFVEGSDGIAVVIVGAGPTGLTAASLLAGYGIASIVIERYTEAYPLPRAVHLDDEGMRILQAAGVGEAFLPLTRPALGMRLLDARHRSMAEFTRRRPLGEHGYPQANMFDQPDLERLLREHVAKLPLVDLRLGQQFQELGQGRVLVDGIWIRADYVLACDGSNSSIRNHIGSAWTDLGFSERWLVVDVRSSRRLATWDGVHQVCDPERAATYMQVGPDRYRWEFRLRADETAASLSPQLGRLLEPWTGCDDLGELEVMRFAEYTFRARLADRWRQGGVFLLGDAAHETPPFIGQGLAAGLRDAMNLAWKLALVAQGRAPDALLDTYQTERLPQARSLVKRAVTVGWAMTGGQGKSARVRRVALSALCRIPAARDGLDRGSPPLKHGPLVQGRLPVGRLFPQLSGASPTRLDDDLGPGFSVVRIGVLSSRTTALAEVLGARVVSARDETAQWLSSQRLDAAVLRPDRVVFAVQRRNGSLTGHGEAALLGVG